MLPSHGHIQERLNFTLSFLQDTLKAAKDTGFNTRFLKSHEGLWTASKRALKPNKKINSVYSCVGLPPALTFLKLLSFASHLETSRYLMGKKVGSCCSREQTELLPYALPATLSNIDHHHHHGILPQPRSLSKERSYATTESNNKQSWCMVSQGQKMGSLLGRVPIAFNTLGFQQTCDTSLPWISLQRGRMLC